MTPDDSKDENVHHPPPAGQQQVSFNGDFSNVEYMHEVSFDDDENEHSSLQSVPAALKMICGD